MNKKYCLLLSVLTIMSSCSKEKKEPTCVKIFNEMNGKEFYKDVKTRNGADIQYILKSGTENPDSSMGCYAADSDSYYKFEEFFRKVAEVKHKTNKSHQEDNQGTELGDFSYEAKKLIKSTRIRVARNFEAKPFPSFMTKDQRTEVESDLKKALHSIDKNGKYYPLESMSDKEKEFFRQRGMLFQDMSSDKYLKSAGISKDFPFARGMFVSEDETRIVWINEEDHMRIISLQNGGDINFVFRNLKEMSKNIGEKIKFAKHPHFGYLSSCPTNIGTGMRASVMIKLVKLSKNLEKMKKIAKEYGLDVRGSAGEHSGSTTGYYDISNSTRFGESDLEILSKMISGVNKLVEIEQSSN